MSLSGQRRTLDISLTLRPFSSVTVGNLIIIVGLYIAPCPARKVSCYLSAGRLAGRQPMIALGYPVTAVGWTSQSPSKQPADELCPWKKTGGYSKVAERNVLREGHEPPL